MIDRDTAWRTTYDGQASLDSHYGMAERYADFGTVIGPEAAVDITECCMKWRHHYRRNASGHLSRAVAFIQCDKNDLISLDAYSMAALSLKVRALLSSTTATRAVPHVKVGAPLKAKMSEKMAYREFVRAVIKACQSNQAAALGIEKCTISEEQDVESPRWVTVTLRAWFSDSDLQRKLDSWSELRRVVDGYTAPLKDGPHKDEILEINDRFFITMGR